MRKVPEINNKYNRQCVHKNWSRHRDVIFNYDVM